MARRAWPSRNRQTNAKVEFSPIYSYQKHISAESIAIYSLLSHNMLLNWLIAMCNERWVCIVSHKWNYYTVYCSPFCNLIETKAVDAKRHNVHTLMGETDRNMEKKHGMKSQLNRGPFQFRRWCAQFVHWPTNDWRSHFGGQSQSTDSSVDHKRFLESDGIR